MEVSRDRPPEYGSRSPDTIVWPSVPQHAPEQHLAPNDITLPDLKTVLSPEFQHQSVPQQGFTSPLLRNASPGSVRSLPRMDPGYADIVTSPKNMDTIMMSPAESASITGSEYGRQRSSSLSMDDPNVRMAAEALSGLGNPGENIAMRHIHASDDMVC